MAVNPDPRTLLIPDPDAIPSFLSDKAVALLAATMGFTSVAYHRYASRRPILSGIQTHLLWSIGGAALARYAQIRREQYLSDRDAVFRHYIELHPEDFPPPQRKKVGEVFTEWVPIR